MKVKTNKQTKSDSESDSATCLCGELSVYSTCVWYIEEVLKSPAGPPVSSALVTRAYRQLLPDEGKVGAWRLLGCRLRVARRVESQWQRKGNGAFPFRCRHAGPLSECSRSRTCASGRCMTFWTAASFFIVSSTGPLAIGLWLGSWYSEGV